MQTSRPPRTRVNREEAASNLPRLYHGSDTLFNSQFEFSPTGLADEFDQVGLLTPGEYRLHVHFAHSPMSLSGNIGSRTINFDVTLDVPAPGMACAALSWVGVVLTYRRRVPLRVGVGPAGIGGPSR